MGEAVEIPRLVTNIIYMFRQSIVPEMIPEAQESILVT